jgi:hypothetical protein
MPAATCTAALCSWVRLEVDETGAADGTVFFPLDATLVVFDAAAFDPEGVLDFADAAVFFSAAGNF